MGLSTKELRIELFAGYLRLAMMPFFLVIKRYLASGVIKRGWKMPELFLEVFCGTIIDTK
jgi:hypothetical protein